MKRKCISFLVVALFTLGSPAVVLAQQFTHYYAVKYDLVNSYDTCVDMNVGDLTLPASGAYGVTKEMWRLPTETSPNNPTQWTEFGELDGTLPDNTAWYGAFIAYSLPNGDSGTLPIGPYPYGGGYIPDQEFCMAVETNSPNWLDYNLNGSLVSTVNTSDSGTSNEMTTGMETVVYSGNSFGGYISGTTEMNEQQVYAGGTGWFFWPSTVGDTNTTGSLLNPVTDSYQITTSCDGDESTCPLLTYY